MIRIACLLVVSALAACTPTQQTPDPAERQQASTYITAWVTQRFGPDPAADLSQCLLQNATATEIHSIANSLSRGQPRSADTTISGVVSRPDTRLCAPPMDLSVQGRLVTRP